MTQATEDNGCLPEGYIMLKKVTLTELMEKCARCKTELNECLERERVKE
jgi:hypothetical protein